MTSLAAIQFDSHYFWQHLFHPEDFFLRAVWTTVYVAVLGQGFGTLLGLPIAMARRSATVRPGIGTGGSATIRNGSPPVW